MDTTNGDSGSRSEAWPELRVEEWQPTRDTLHMWTQIVGKVRMELAAPLNHWWHVPLYINARGLTTSMMPHRSGGMEMQFDFADHTLDILTADGERREIALEPRSVADFYGEVMGRLGEIGVEIDMLARPVEVPESIPFAEDTEHDSYDADQVDRFWRVLVDSDRVFNVYRSGFVGKQSPLQFFWGSFDLAVSRFSGRPAPLHPGGIPNVASWVMHEAYSHELAAAGYWPGGSEEGVFYAYAYPEPDGYRDAELASEAGHFDETLGEFVLPYRTVRTASDPDATLLEFLEAAYAVAADLGDWDRSALEVDRAATGADR